MRRMYSMLLTAAVLLGAVPLSHAEGPAAGPTLSCASAILVEKETGQVLVEQNAHQKLEPASVTKVMTLLLVMEAVDEGRLSLDEMVTVSAHASGMGGSQVYLKEGEQMSVREMLKCVAVASANDCAVALAEHLSGSEEAFVTAMNQRAQALGMEDTTFRNCTGLPASGHMTTAYDIAQMSRALILGHPDIRQYTTIWMDSIRDGAFGLTNTNRLIRFYPGATGLKTGSTDSARYCMSATAERDGMELIAVIMKAPTTVQRFEDAKALLDYGFANYTLAKVYPDAPLPTVEVLLGEKHQVQPVPQRECSLLLDKAHDPAPQTRVTLSPDVEAPVEEGQVLGTLEVLVGDEVRDTVPLVASEEVPRLTTGTIFTRMLRSLLMAG